MVRNLSDDSVKQINQNTPYTSNAGGVLKESKGLSASAIERTPIEISGVSCLP